MLELMIKTVFLYTTSINSTMQSDPKLKVTIMKKIIFLFLVILTTLSLASCVIGNDDETDNTSNTNTANSNSVPAAPGAAVVTAANGELILSWTAVDGAASYELWLSETGDSAAAELKADNITGTSYTVTGLINDKTYYIWIKAENSAGTSGFGTIAEGKPVNVWYYYKQNTWGFAKLQQSLSFDSTTFQEMISYWDGSQWIPIYGLKGSVQFISGNQYTFTLESIYFSDSSSPGTSKWFNNATTEFSNYLSYIWSYANKTNALATLTASGDSLVYKRDQDDNNSVDGNADYTLTLGKSSTSDLPGSGSYPYCNYVGLGIHSNYTSVSSHSQLMSMTGELLDDSASSLVKNISIKIKESDGILSSSQALTWDSSRNEWGISPYTYTAKTPGMWYVAEVKIEYKNGSSATYSATSLYNNFTVSYTTDTGYSCSNAVTDLFVPQDYMPPASAPSGTQFYYIELVPNASTEYDAESGDPYIDPQIFLYKDGDYTNWISRNDDGGYFTLFPALKIPLEEHQTYYLKVIDLNNRPGAYSVNINTTAFTETGSTGTVSGPDAYEEDDDYTRAKTFTFGTCEDRTYESGDPDWIKIVVP